MSRCPAIHRLAPLAPVLPAFAAVLLGWPSEASALLRAQAGLRTAGFSLADTRTWPSLPREWQSLRVDVVLQPEENR